MPDNQKKIQSGYLVVLKSGDSKMTVVRYLGTYASKGNVLCSYFVEGEAKPQSQDFSEEMLESAAD